MVKPTNRGLVEEDGVCVVAADREGWGASYMRRGGLSVVEKVSSVVSSVGTTVALPSRFRWALHVLAGLGIWLEGFGDLQKATETLLRYPFAGLVVAQRWETPRSIKEVVPETTWGLGVQRGMLQLLRYAWSWQMNSAGSWQ